MRNLSILFSVALMLLAVSTCKILREVKVHKIKDLDKFNLTSNSTQIELALNISQKAGKLLNQYFDAIDEVSTMIFNNFKKMSGRDMTLNDFLYLIELLKKEGQANLRVEEVNRIFLAYDQNHDSLLQLDEFRAAFREVYLQSVNLEKIKKSSFLQSSSGTKSSKSSSATETKGFGWGCAFGCFW
jgi:hypothetical protein